MTRKSIRTIVAALFLLGGTLVMVTLGIWQVQRMEWKQGVIHELDTLYETVTPHQFSYQELINAHSGGETLLYGTIAGTPLIPKQMLFGPKPHEGNIGYHVVTPVAINGDKNATILVQRGFIQHDEAPAIENIKAPQSVTFTGIIRKPDWNKYTPNNSPENGIWSKLDIEEIGRYQELENIAPYILYTARTQPPFDEVTPLSERWYPRNKHKQYAIFWFSMAAIFLGFFALVAYKGKFKSKV